MMIKTVTLTFLGGLSGLLLASSSTSSPEMAFSRIAKYGGVADVANAVDPPRPDAKVVFDIAAEGAADAVHPGIESVARYVNLHAAAGHASAGLKISAVLHGGATNAALTDAAYKEHLEVDRNPNADLISKLREAGVEVLVCGQSLARKGYSTEEVSKEMHVAVSAMTVVVNRQQDGFALISIR